MSVDEWTMQENTAIVADYFDMLANELAQRPYNKAERNRVLQSRIGRGRGSIEYKHQNISAVIKGLGETWIEGYKPAFNYQRSLEDAVLEWLNKHPEWYKRPSRPVQLEGMSEGPELWIGPAPTLSNHLDPSELQQTLAVAHRYDVAGRDERNRALGKRGEEMVVVHERQTLAQSGRRDLAERVKWVSDVEGDGAGFDIASFQPDGKNRLIEVKTTNGWERTPFHISSNELAVADRHRSEWCLMRLWNFSREPRAFELYPPLQAHIALTPTSFIAMLR